MKFIRWSNWFGHNMRHDTKKAKEVERHLAETSIEPLADQVRKVQVDYIQSLMALGRANAEARRMLAEQTLINVQGKVRYVPQNRF